MIDRPATPLPPNVHALRCIACGHDHHDFWDWDCAACGGDRMDVVYGPEALEQVARDLATPGPIDQWRYRAVLPLPEGAALLPISVGGSPLSAAPRLAEHLGVKEVWLKDDGRNSSGSLKDRPSALGVVLAMAMKQDRIVCASTGNAASSTACAAASVGLPATIFVPQRAPAPKVAQLKMFGAQVLRVAADYDTTWDLCAQVASRRPWFNRNCAYNPYLVEGKKTAAWEVADQQREDITDWVVWSVGDGCTIAGGVKGLEEAHRAGIIPRLPRVLGVQAEGAAPLVKAAADGQTTFEPGPADSLADSIAVGHPRNGVKALKAVDRNGGAWVSVSDEAILAAAIATARLGGVFGAPAAAAATAGVQTAVEHGIIGKGETVTIIVSGNGLKDTDSALKAAGEPIDVAADLDAIEAVLNG